eukprot:958075-Amorphochlora_amoeboformis.AAC.1
MKLESLGVFFFNRKTGDVFAEDASLYNMGREGLQSIGMKFVKAGKARRKSLRTSKSNSNA